MAVVSFEIQSREPYEGGMPFGDAGAYERIEGRLHVAVDPLHAANAGIVDLDRAARQRRNYAEIGHVAGGEQKGALTSDEHGEFLFEKLMRLSVTADQV